MAETWCKAFGRYLRTLRQRRGLSLQEVCSLSRAFAENLDKGYLSRCENGHQSPAFSKVIPLSRIYDAPADVLLERLELDMELERVGGPDTEGMTFAELEKHAEEALNQGFKWNAYAFARDAVSHSDSDPVSPAFENRQEQIASAHMNCATVSLSLGRPRYSLHEFLYIQAGGALGKSLGVVLFERLSKAYRHLGQLDQARVNAEHAVSAAEATDENEFLGYVYSNRASQAYNDGDLDAAATYYQESHRAFGAVGRTSECARSLHNLAQVFFDLKRLGAARRALVGAERIMKPLQQNRTLALGHILMGEIESMERSDERAVSHWKEAASIAKQLNDKVLRFKAEFLLFKQAHENGNTPVARSIHRRLAKLSNWVPETTPELQDFARLSAESKEAI